MKTLRMPHPIFKVEDKVEAWESILGKAVSEVNPLYFDANPRFNGIGKVSSSTLVDYMGIYEEGSWWALTIIQVTSASSRQPKYLFLPLATQIAGLVVPFSETLPSGIENTIFELETNSTFYGRRNWRVVDGFADHRFYIKMLNLFLPWDNLPQTHVNAYTQFHESGIGKFMFHASQDFQEQLVQSDRRMKISLKFNETNNFLVRYSKFYQLVVHRILLAADNNTVTRPSSNLLGWINYAGIERPKLLIGVLERIVTS